MDGLPDECLLSVLAKLGPNDLVMVAGASHRLAALSNDDALWRPLFERYAGASVVRRIERTMAPAQSPRNGDKGNDRRAPWKERTRLFITTAVEMTVFTPKYNEWAPDTRDLARFATARVMFPLGSVCTAYALVRGAMSVCSGDLDSYHVWLVNGHPNDRAAFALLRLLFAHGEKAPLIYEASWYEAMWVHALATMTGLSGMGTIRLAINVALLLRCTVIAQTNPLRIAIQSIVFSPCAAKRNATPVDPADPSSQVGMRYDWSAHRFSLVCAQGCSCSGPRTRSDISFS